MHECVQAVIFDLDGVITDTAELHYRSWQRLADELGLPFDRAVNERLRGLGRLESLAIVLGDAAARFADVEKQRLAERKNRYYLESVARMTQADLLPGIEPLLAELRSRGMRLGIASSSRNAMAVVERLGIAGCFEAVIDGNAAIRSKPDPEVFLLAAQRLGATPARCVVIEDAESGVAAARAAGMKVVGVGPAERVGRADVVVADTSQLRADLICGMH